ncbi:MAG: phytanoyl-CoA dioxygenase family protein [Candidatus Latescibacteria bacterium]|nr:phytanoyl-CoA dioxygenase family protein [Candidatus Latescibacterota bacterium]
MIDLAEAKTRLADEGYCILEGLLNPDEAERLDALARPLMPYRSGYVKLEGALNHIPGLAPLCMHPAVLEIAEHFLGKEFYLPNNVCLMWCQPGAPAGGLHSDWPLGLVPQPWPRWPFLIQTLWMLTDFTPENGATHVVPGSHLSGRPPAPNLQYSHERPAVGTKGSVLIWQGGTWHANGANTTTSQHRMGANLGYVPWFVHRPPDAWPLLRRELYEQFPERLQQLLKRSVEP